MKIYKLTPCGYNSCWFTSLEAVIEELKSIFEYGDFADISVNIETMDIAEEAWKAVPEFEGY